MTRASYVHQVAPMKRGVVEGLPARDGVSFGRDLTWGPPASTVGPTVGPTARRDIPTSTCRQVECCWGCQWKLAMKPIPSKLPELGLQ